MHTVIIGNGIAGITAARFLRKNSDSRITVISDETDYFFSRTALMYIYMGDLTYEQTKPYEDWFWGKNRIELVRDYVMDIDFDGQQLSLRDGPPIRYDKLLIATGSNNNMAPWPGIDSEGVQTLYSIQDLERMEENTTGVDHAVMVGGGLIGVEMAEMMHTREIPITFLVRESGYWGNILPNEEAHMISDHMREYGVDVQHETELAEVTPDDNGRVKAVKTKDGQTIECQFLGVTIGVHPNIKLVKDTKLETDNGILVDEYLRTSIPNVFAAGDCAQLRNPPEGRAPTEPVWYVGRMQGRTVGLNIAGKEIPYEPGVWFNSAKFFDIEYQVYGDIKPELPEEEESLYWQRPDGKKSIRINYRKEDGTVIGFNLMGIRYRHQICAKWIKEGASITQVLRNLKTANFDPEFHKQYESRLVEHYNQQNPDNPVKLRSKTGLLSKAGALFSLW